MYALVDCNNFYVSCERMFNPKLNGKPVIVLSNNDGCAISRSNEAKALGIKMGEPIFKVKPLVKRHNIHLFSPNFSLYGDMSERVMNSLAEFSPNIEIYSIDEAFLNLEDRSNQDMTTLAKTIKQRIYKWLGIPVSVGIGKTKTIAKVATKIAKKSTGTLAITDSASLDKKLEKFSVNEIWGIGSAYTKKLNRRGVYNALQFKSLPDEWIRKNMTIMGLRTAHELRGTSCIPIEDLVPRKKSICVSRSFGKLVTTKAELEESIAQYASMATEKLRQEKCYAKTITVFVMTNPFREGDQQYQKGINIVLPEAVDDTRIMIKAALKGLDRIYKEGLNYKKSGVILDHLQSSDYFQMNIFNREFDFKKSKELMAAYDEINHRYGRNMIRFSVCGVGQEWKSQFKNRSNRFTTCWDELPVVRLN